MEPSLIRERTRLEQALEARLIALAGHVPIALSAAEVCAALEELAAAPNPRSLSAYMEAEGTIEQFREFAIHRSAYQLKEADPHTLGDPAPHRPRQGGARRDPARRIRQRRASSTCTPTSSPRSSTSSASTTPTGRTSTGSPPSR